MLLGTVRCWFFCYSGCWSYCKKYFGMAKNNSKLDSWKRIRQVRNRKIRSAISQMNFKPKYINCMCMYLNYRYLPRGIFIKQCTLNWIHIEILTHILHKYLNEYKSLITFTLSNITKQVYISVSEYFSTYDVITKVIHLLKWRNIIALRRK